MKTSYSKNLDHSNFLDDNTEYREIIGVLLYIATVSQPATALAVNLLSRNIEKPFEKAGKSVQKIIIYLNTIKNKNLNSLAKLTPFSLDILMQILLQRRSNQKAYKKPQAVTYFF